MTPAYIVLLFSVASQTHGLPQGLLSAVCYIETTHNVSALNAEDGGSPSLGICQVKLDTARLLGFKGNARQLARPSENIYWASKYLKQNLQRYDGDIAKAVSAYNAGSHQYNSQGLTVNRKYVSNVLKAWAGNQ